MNPLERLIADLTGDVPHSVTEFFEVPLASFRDDPANWPYIGIAEGVGCGAPHCAGRDGVMVTVATTTPRTRDEEDGRRTHPGIIRLGAFSHAHADGTVCAFDVATAEQLVNRLTEAIAAARIVESSTE